MPDVEDPKLGTSVASRFRLDERLAAGGMGVVYKGTDLKTKKPVAVKFVHDAFAAVPQLVKRFEREVTAMSRVSHDNLVNIVGSGAQAGVPYLVMDFHEGSSLGDLIEKGALAPARAIDLATQILAGVGHVHASGVVHRDLKPDNIMVVDENGKEVVKILDFGLAKMLSEEAGGTQLTNTGFALGTPGYMAPEQARGGDTDERTDVYAVGVILYHMIAGRKPFVAESPMAVLRMHMDEAPLPLRKVPRVKLSAQLDNTVLRALEKDPKSRWPSAADFAKALQATPEAKGEKVADEPPPQATRMQKKVKVKKLKTKTMVVPIGPRRWPMLVLIALVAGGGAYGWSRLSRRNKDDVKQSVKDVKQTVQSGFKDGVAKPVKEAVDGLKEALHDVTTQDKRGAEKKPEVKPPPVDDDDDDDQPVVPPKDTPGAQLEAEAPAVAKPNIDTAFKLLSTGKVDPAIQMLYAVRKQAPRSPAVPLLLGHAYFRKQWRSDGLREYDTALQLKPALRYDKQLVKNVVSALEDPTARSARALVKARIGVAALPELRRVARTAPSAKVKVRAAKLASDVSRRRRR
jgi:serine/threonine protein kinase